MIKLTLKDLVNSEGALIALSDINWPHGFVRIGYAVGQLCLEADDHLQAYHKEEKKIRAEHTYEASAVNPANGQPGKVRKWKDGGEDHYNAAVSELTDVEVVFERAATLELAQFEQAAAKLDCDDTRAQYGALVTFLKARNLASLHWLIVDTPTNPNPNGGK